MRRYDIKAILSDPAKRRMLIAQSTVATMAREGIDITLQQALDSWDLIQKEKLDDRNKPVKIITSAG